MSTCVSSVITRSWISRALASTEAGSGAVSATAQADSATSALSPSDFSNDLISILPREYFYFTTLIRFDRVGSGALASGCGRGRAALSGQDPPILGGHGLAARVQHRALQARAYASDALDVIEHSVGRLLHEQTLVLAEQRAGLLAIEDDAQRIDENVRAGVAETDVLVGPVDVATVQDVGVVESEI